MDKLKLNSFNCRGLREKSKRIDIFQWLKDSNLGITFLQETHCSDTDKKEWERDWGGKIFFSNGTTQSRGVAILIPKKFKHTFKPISEKCSNDGRLLILTCEIENIIFTLVNVYAPTRDHPAAQLQFISYLKAQLDEYATDNILIGGDFNTHLNPLLDKKGGTRILKTDYAKLVENLMTEFNLVDIWRARHAYDLKFTRTEKSRTGLIQSRLDYWLVSEGTSYLINNCTIKPGKRSDHSLIKLEVELN